MAKTLDQFSGMPQMGAALSGWSTPITLIVITQEIIDGFVTNFEKKVSFKGVIQPLSPRKLELKPEGQRTWKWLQIHCLSGSLKLKAGDKILYAGERFKLMADNDFSLNNFNEYHVVKDYQNEFTT